MARTRICMICGRNYEFCHHCKEFQKEPGWKYLYHDEKCKKIGDLWYAYRGKEISKEEARKLMGNLKPNINDALKYTGTIASNEIREIFDVKEEDSIAETSAAEVVKETNVSEKQPVKRRNSKKDNHESE